MIETVIEMVKKEEKIGLQVSSFKLKGSLFNLPFSRPQDCTNW
jgi:hypothetical protein